MNPKSCQPQTAEKPTNRSRNSRRFCSSNSLHIYLDKNDVVEVLGVRDAQAAHAVRMTPLLEVAVEVPVVWRHITAQHITAHHIASHHDEKHRTRGRKNAQFNVCFLSHERGMNAVSSSIIPPRCISHQSPIEQPVTRPSRLPNVGQTERQIDRKAALHEKYTRPKLVHINTYPGHAKEDTCMYVRLVACGIRCTSRKPS